MGRIIPRQTIEDIKMRTDIVELVGGFIRLKRSGSTYKALCPFHREKTPSFHVNPHKQIFHCFGCGKSGDVFGFLMEYEGMDFTEAVRFLAERGGVQLDWEENRADGKTDKNLLYRIHGEVAAFYHKLLKNSETAGAARDYLAQRRLDATVRDDFQLGYAPDAWDAVIQWAQKKKYALKHLDALGLITTSEKSGTQKRYDRFRHRMMIPVRDEMGRTIAFSGRVLRKDQVGGKYVNSPETVLFNKSRVLFGIDRARHNIADKGCAILCEGQIDAIRCHQAGFTHTVATQGTALTEQHAHLLHRYTDQVVLVLDADKAGQDAALRGALVLLDAGVMVRLVRLPPDEDPDSLLLRENGPARFSELIDGAMSVIEFHVELLREREDVTSEAGTLRAGHALLETIMHAPTDILRDRFIREAATRMNIREQSLRADLRRMRRRTRRPQKAESPAPAEPASVHPPEEVALVELLLHHLEVAPLIETYVTPEDVSDLQCREFVHILIEHQEDGESFRLMDHVDSRDTEAVRFAARLEAHPGRIIGVEIPPARAAQDLILKLRSRRCARERSRLAEKLRVAQGPESTELRRRSMELAHRMSCLRLGWEKALPILEVMRTAE